MTIYEHNIVPNSYYCIYRKAGDHRKNRDHSPPNLQSGIGDPNVDKGKDKSGSGHRGSSIDKRTDKDQENDKKVLGNEDSHVTRSMEDLRRSLSDDHREKNVLFPSGSDTVNRGECSADGMLAAVDNLTLTIRVSFIQEFFVSGGKYCDAATWDL